MMSPTANCWRTSAGHVGIELCKRVVGVPEFEVAALPTGKEYVGIVRIPGNSLNRSLVGSSAQDRSGLSSLAHLPNGDVAYSAIRISARLRFRRTANLTVRITREQELVPVMRGPVDRGDVACV